MEYLWSSGFWWLLQTVDFLGAGDGGRTRDVQLGKLTVDSKCRTLASTALILAD